MGGGLALNAADVTMPDGSVEKAIRVSVLGDRLRLTRGREAVVDDTGVRALTRPGPRLWTITMADGQVYRVDRGKGCSTCGGR